MRALAALSLLAMPLAAQTVTSAAPDKVGVTIYRDPNGGSGGMNLQWLGGFALVSETRRVSLPAGEVELRFEGVAENIIPQSALVSGIDEALVEKNRDARLLSAGSLLAAHLGQRMTLRRTDHATGKVREEAAVVRASDDGVVLQTAAGFEALRCTGMPETLLATAVPPGLSARPTLSVRLRLMKPYQGAVRLTYLSHQFDWRAHYVAMLGDDGRTMALSAQLTVANGDATGFAGADLLAVAGQVNREAIEVVQPEAPPITLNCWPMQRTHQVPFDGGYPPPPPPPPPPPAPLMAPVAMAERDSAESIIVSGARVKAEREQLGTLNLYRVPVSVDIPSQSQKQVGLIDLERVKIESSYYWRTRVGEGDDGRRSAQRQLRFFNRARDGAGQPLPAGGVTIFARWNGQPLLLGETRTDDRTLEEKIEWRFESPGIRLTHKLVHDVDDVDEHWTNYEIRAASDLAKPTVLEVQIDPADDARPLKPSARLIRRDGADWWIVTVPANGEAVLRYRVKS